MSELKSRVVRVTTKVEVAIYVDVTVKVPDDEGRISTEHSVKDYVKTAMSAGITLPWQCDFRLDDGQIHALSMVADYKFHAKMLLPGLVDEPIVEPTSHPSSK